MSNDQKQISFYTFNKLLQNMSEAEQKYNSFGNPIGKQVAFNRERNSLLTLHRTDNTDEIYFTDVRLDRWYLIRNSYFPKGNELQYPTEWGKKRAIEHFIKFYLDSHKETISRLQKRVDEFESFLTSDEHTNMMEGVIPQGVVDTKLVTVQGKKVFV